MKIETCMAGTCMVDLSNGRLKTVIRQKFETLVCKEYNHQALLLAKILKASRRLGSLRIRVQICWAGTLLGVTIAIKLTD